MNGISRCIGALVLSLGLANGLKAEEPIVEIWSKTSEYGKAPHTVEFGSRSGVELSSRSGMEFGPRSGDLRGVKEFEYDFDGDGVVDKRVSPFDGRPITHTYESEGIYNPTVSVTGKDGKKYYASMIVAVDLK